MLTNTQMNDSRRHHTLAQYFVDNAAKVATYAPLATEVAKHASNVSTLDGLVPKKDVVTRGITLDKTSLQENVAQRALVICNKAVAFGLSFNHIPLAESLKTSFTLIMRINDEDFLPFIQHVSDLITPFIADADFIPYGVTAGDLATLVTDATTFDGMIGDATTASSTAQVANVDIDLLLDGKLRQNLVQFDLLMVHFAVSDPDFFRGYKINSAVENLGVHHSGIEGVIAGPRPPDEPSSVPLSGVTVKILGTNKVALSNVLGHYSITRVKTGDYNVEVSAAGYRTLTRTVHISRGRIETTDFVLVPA